MQPVKIANGKNRLVGILQIGRLRVVPLSICPSCVTRKKTSRQKKKKAARSPGGEEHARSMPTVFRVERPFFPRGSHGLSERGTTRSLQIGGYVYAPRIVLKESPFGVAILQCYKVEWRLSFAFKIF